MTHDHRERRKIPRMKKLVPLVAVALLAACGSSAAKASAPTSPTTAATTTEATTTEAPATTAAPATTTGVSRDAKVAVLGCIDSMGAIGSHMVVEGQGDRSMLTACQNAEDQLRADNDPSIAGFTIANELVLVTQTALAIQNGASDAGKQAATLDAGYDKWKSDLEAALHL